MLQNVSPAPPNTSKTLALDRTPLSAVKSRHAVLKGVKCSRNQLYRADAERFRPASAHEPPRTDRPRPDQNPEGLMLKVNTNRLEEITWASPKGKYRGAGKQVSEALGRDPVSTDLRRRHPFDVEICRIPPGKIPYPYHSHSAQWEFYHVISGTGIVRHKDGTSLVEPGDAFLFEPGEPHQLINDASQDLVLYVVADNPIGESCHFPDSRKWMVRSPERQIISSDPLEYYAGEE